MNATETLSTEKLSGSSSVWIEVLNVNDNNPKFNASLYNYTFDEEVPKGFVIARVTVSNTVTVQSSEPFLLKHEAKSCLKMLRRYPRMSKGEYSFIMDTLQNYGNNLLLG